ncbi:MAG: SEC-C metal-binding domain-containing protein [Proteobacteria bacterium]|nr:SEC-C metal-binding domain-containing protein [Pseudomonadota bacterium]
MLPQFSLPDFSVIVWVWDREDFDELRAGILSVSSEPPYENNKYQGMVDFHFGFDNFPEALALAEKIKPIAQHTDVVLLSVQSRIDDTENVTLKDQRPTNKNVGRNDPCSCGSGKKFKKCCLH